MFHVWTGLWVYLMLAGLSSYLIILTFFLSEKSMVISWEIWEKSGMSVVFLFDEFSLCFILMVSCVSSAVFFYSLSYMSSDLSKKKFGFILFLFVLSMFTLSLSGNLLSVMIGWDGLGLSSFCLIIFYQSWKSFGSGMVTFMTNRAGDVFLILSISLLLMSEGGSSGKLSFNYVSLGILLFLAGSTKSAQLPFSAWLPLAMAAPTPVSSLVHSSTLVTAGIFLLIRFYNLLTEEVKMMLFIMSSLTITLAGLSSLAELDFKKVVALSTLSHIALMMLFISTGAIYPAMTHMFMHAFFKSSLFMCVGEMIHSQEGWQDIRVIRMALSDYSLRLSLYVACVSMMGLPFLSGFYSKEFLLSNVEESSLNLLFLVFLLAVFLTASYSARILSMTWSLSSGKSGSLTTLSGKKHLLLIWSIFSLISSGIFFSFWPFSTGEISLVYSFLVFSAVILGGFFGSFFSIKKMEKLLWLFGGKEGMWSVLSLTLLPVKVSWKSSLSYMSEVDFMGLTSMIPMSTVGLLFSMGEVVEWMVKFAIPLFTLFSITVFILLFSF